MITRSISEGLKFAFSFKRILPYIIINLIIFYILIVFFKVLIALTKEFEDVFKILFSLSFFIPAFIAIGLVSLWINGAIIDQAKYFPRKRSLFKSFKFSAKMYWSMLGATIIYGIIALIISSPPYIGFILALALNLALFYLYQSIIVEKKGCIDSFKQSFKTFMNYPLETFVTWILTSIISIILVGIFASPLLLLLLVSFTDLFIKPSINVTEEGILIRSIEKGIRSTITSPFFIPYLFVFSIGLAFNWVFLLGVKTRLYINASK